MSSNKIRVVLVGIAVIAIVGVGIILVIQTDDQQEDSENIVKQPKDEQLNKRAQNTSNNFSGIDLSLPFNIDDIDEQRGEVNPLGVVRFSKDQPEYGHSGVDIPLKQGAPIYAVANGPIVLVKSAGDPWGGQGVFQLLKSTANGEGWAFIYEHISPAAGMKSGSEIEAGDLLGTKTPPVGFTAHFQLSYVFNNYEFTRGMECWIDDLNKISSNKLMTWWNKYRVSSNLIDSWRTNNEEGRLPFRGLLDTTRFPDGPQLCYPPGTDVR